MEIRLLGRSSWREGRRRAVRGSVGGPCSPWRPFTPTSRTKRATAGRAVGEQAPPSAATYSRPSHACAGAGRHAGQSAWSQPHAATGRGRRGDRGRPAVCGRAEPLAPAAEALQAEARPSDDLRPLLYQPRGEWQPASDRGLHPARRGRARSQRSALGALGRRTRQQGSGAAGIFPARWVASRHEAPRSLRGGSPTRSDHQGAARAGAGHLLPGPFAARGRRDTALESVACRSP